MRFAAQILKFKVYEDQAVHVMQRIMIPNAANDDIVPATASDVESITYNVFVDGVPLAGQQNVSVVVASAMRDALVSGDDRWTKDNEGYNFLYVLPPGAVPEGSKVYRVEFAFTFTAYHPATFALDLVTQEILSS